MKNTPKKIISLIALTAISALSINAGAATINKYGQFDSQTKIVKVSSDDYYSSSEARLGQILRGNGTCGIGC